MQFPVCLFSPNTKKELEFQDTITEQQRPTAFQPNIRSNIHSPAPVPSSFAVKKNAHHVIIPSSIIPPSTLVSDQNLPFCAFFAICDATNPESAVPSISTPLVFIPPFPPPPPDPRLAPPPPDDRFLSPSSPPFSLTFIAPAPSAAVITLTPLAPAHGPGSDRIVMAAMPPAWSAAAAACCHRGLSPMPVVVFDRFSPGFSASGGPRCLGGDAGRS